MMRIAVLMLSGALLVGCSQALPNVPATEKRFGVQFSQKAPVTPVGHEYLTPGWATFPSSAKAPETVVPGWATFPSSAKAPETAVPGWATFPSSVKTTDSVITGIEWPEAKDSKN